MTKLQRHIGLLSLALYGLGDILGAGIYGLVGKAAGEMGHAAWMAFGAAMIAAVLTGLSYASVASRYPRAAGAAYVSFRAFKSPFLAYVTGLVVFSSGLMSMATSSRVFAGYLTGWLPELPLPLAILGFAALVTFICFWGIRESMWVNTLCTLVEVSGLLFVIYIGYQFIGGEGINYFSASTPAKPDQDLNFGLVMSGGVLAFFSFIGFEDVLNMGEEVKNPERTMPRAMLLAIAGSATIYILIAVVAVSTVPLEVLINSKEPLLEVVRIGAPWFPPNAYRFVAMFAVANTALLNFIMSSRLLYGMSKQGLMPQVLGRVHATRKTPHIAVAVVCLVLLALAFSGEVASLAKGTALLLLLCFVIVNISLFVLQGRRGEAKAYFEVPRFIPILATIICATLLCFAKLEDHLRAGAILLIIFALYAVMRPSKAKVLKSLED